MDQQQRQSQKQYNSAVDRVVGQGPAGDQFKRVPSLQYKWPPKSI